MAATSDLEEMRGLPVIRGGMLVRLDGRNLHELARLCAECTNFFQLVYGQPGGESTSKEILGPVPPHVKTGCKHIFGIYMNDEMEGIVELLENYPKTSEWYLGLLVIRPECRGYGLGTSVWAGLKTWIQTGNGSIVRLMVQKQNPNALRFWERNDFEIEGDIHDRSSGVASCAWKLRLSIQTVFK
ncbi:MAG TPA: GNAT family N-acetyltransferase [Noviherbaspirillum sp.]|uniref:GNAT family N-acetyltransferase n=1 Tax=Noviherbaspirillum sp. TaxID=1926288 RepID=UPI002F9434A4